MGRNGRRIEMISTNNTDGLIEIVSQWVSLTEMPLFYVGILFVATFALIVLLSQRKSKKLAMQQSTQLEKLQKALMVANSTTIGMGQKLIHLEKQLQADLAEKKNINKQLLDKEQCSRPEKETINASNMFAKPTESTPYNQQRINSINTLSLVNNDSLQHDELPSDEAYEKSRQLISQGVEIPEIVKQSGLSFSEVSLMKKLAQ
jgi:hypothetical protein